jgi:hypothetical protein
MKFGYADPPYLGRAAKFYGELHADAAVYDTVEGHHALIDRLCDEFADGWAMSLHTPSLRTILPLCPEDVRVMAWVKPFCSFKKGVGVAYAWEPIIVRGGAPTHRTSAHSARLVCGQYHAAPRLCRSEARSADLLAARSFQRPSRRRHRRSVPRIWCGHARDRGMESCARIACTERRAFRSTRTGSEGMSGLKFTNDGGQHVSW